MTTPARCEHVDKNRKPACRKPVAQADRGRARYCEFHRSDEEVAKRKARIVAESRRRANQRREAGEAVVEVVVEAVQHHAYEYFFDDLERQIREAAAALRDMDIKRSRALALADQLDRSKTALGAIRHELAAEQRHGR